MIAYIIQVVLFQILFLTVYDFFLSKETFHNYNRWYLLGTPIVSFVLPLIKIPTMQKAMPEELMVFLPEILLSPQTALEETVFYTQGSINYLNVLFWSGVALFLLIFLVKLFKIGQLIKRNETVNKIFYKLVLLPKNTNAFSFFNFIFLGKEISKEKQEQIIEHELVHSKQKHTLDLLFFEFLRIVMWFNPMIYFYQQRITLLHEYITDSEVVKTTEKHDYFNKLLAQTFQVENISFINQFYKHSLIKKRITMMTKKKSKQIKKAKYLLLLPLLASMLLYTACEKNDVILDDNSAKNKELSNESKMPFLMLKEVVVGRKNEVMEVSINDKLSAAVRTFVARNFNAEISKTLNLKDNKFKIYTVFTVNSNGEIENVKVRAPHPKLKEETERVLAMLPTLTPAIKNGEYVSGKYTLPISYNINSLKYTFKKFNSANDTDVPFAVIEEVPVYPGCVGTREQKAKCLNKKIQTLVRRNFNADLSKTVNLPKGRKKVWVIFRIDENGDVVDVGARAPHPKLKEEAMRVARLLPKMKAGRQRGKAVGMKYTLPISFTVE